MLLAPSVLASAARPALEDTSQAVQAALHPQQLRRQPIGTNSTLCPLAKPIVLLKAGRAGSSAIELDLVEVLKGCLGYQEISHDDALVKPNGCTPHVIQKQMLVWKEALRSNAIISHNPVTSGGGCFSSLFAGGARRLTELLQQHEATVISWTRNNVLRQRYSEWLAAKTHDYNSTRRETPLWDEEPEQVVNAVTNGGCEMLAIQSALRKSTTSWKQHIVYEDFARDPLRTMEQVLEWAALKPGFSPAELLHPHRAWLSRRPEPDAESFAYALAKPDEVLAGLKSVCLDWTFWGGSYTKTHVPQPMCLGAPSCAAFRPTINCGCDQPAAPHSTRNMAWLEVAQPKWWLDQSTGI